MNPLDQHMQTSFQDRYCRMFHCSNDEFEYHVLWKVMYPQAIPFAKLIGLFNRNFFAVDLRIIRQLGVTTSMQEIAQLANELRNDYRQESRLFRVTLRVRISGKRMVELAKEVMPQPE